jgi:Rrf2 family protein
MRLSAKTDYALRACTEIASRNGGKPASSEELSARQDIPPHFLKELLPELGRAGILESRRGRSGGWSLTRPAEQVSVADVIRAVDGPLASIDGVQPQDLHYRGSARPYREIWVAVRWSLRNLLESVTIADVAAGNLPDLISTAIDQPDAWTAR